MRQQSGSNDRVYLGRQIICLRRKFRTKDGDCFSVVIVIVEFDRCFFYVQQE